MWTAYTFDQDDVNKLVNWVGTVHAGSFAGSKITPAGSSSRKGVSAVELK